MTEMVQIKTSDGEFVEVPASHLKGAIEYRKWEPGSLEATNLEGGDVPPQPKKIKTDWQPGDAITANGLTGTVVGKREDGRFDVAWSNGVTTPMRPEKMSA